VGAFAGQSASDSRFDVESGSVAGAAGDIWKDEAAGGGVATAVARSARPACQPATPKAPTMQPKAAATNHAPKRFMATGGVG
jgi:hypothetical protein